MKTKILKAIFVAVVAMVAGINVYNAQKTKVLSDVAMANVEALASDGEHYMGNGTCKGAGAGMTDVYCYGGYTICCWAHMDVFGKN